MMDCAVKVNHIQTTLTMRYFRDDDYDEAAYQVEWGAYELIDQHRRRRDQQVTHNPNNVMVPAAIESNSNFHTCIRCNQLILGF